MTKPQTDLGQQTVIWLAVAVSILASGCFSRTTGTQGQFAFAYPAAADIIDFNKPIAPGARLDIFARALGSNDELKIAHAKSSDPQVITIDATHQNFITVLAKTVGTARITIRTADGATDTVDMHVRTPERVVLRHACTDDEFAVYPAHAEVVIPFSLEKADGQPVVGYGFWPLKVRPIKALALDRDSHAQGALWFQSTGPRHRVSIRSTIDDNLLGLALVTNDQIDEVRLSELGMPRLIEGDRGLVMFEPWVAGVKMCQGELTTRAKSLTPEICDASGQLGEEEDDENTLGFVRVTAHQFGICVVEAEFPGTNEGEGLVQRFEIPVGRMPDHEGEKTEGAPTWLAPLIALLAPLALFPLLRRRI